MSVVDYDFGRRYSSHGLSFPDYYSHYNERNVPLALSQHARSDPRGYPIGGPVGSPRRNPGAGRDEHTMEIGHARRRIAVAVSSVFESVICWDTAPLFTCSEAGIQPLFLLPTTLFHFL